MIDPRKQDNLKLIGEINTTLKHISTRIKSTNVDLPWEHINSTLVEIDFTLIGMSEHIDHIINNAEAGSTNAGLSNKPKLNNNKSSGPSIMQY